jgi:hypothetical protein
LYRGNAIWGDFDNDGYPEAIIFSTDGGWGYRAIYLENTAGTLSCGHFTDLGLPDFTNDRWDWSSAWIDYNSDGWLDLLMFGRQGNDGVAELYKNNGATVNGDDVKRFELVANTGITGLHYSGEESVGLQSRIAVGDYNNDGYPDFIVTGITGSSDSKVYHLDLYKNNGGDGTFALQTAPVNGTDNFTTTSAGNVMMADFDNDGWLDIIMNGWNTNHIYKNNSDGTFSVYAAFNADDFRTADGDMGVGDLNGDGKLDILMTGGAFDRNHIQGYDDWVDNTAAFYLSNNTQGYDLFPQGNITRMRRTAIELIDLNADGALDIVIAGDGWDADGWDGGYQATNVYLRIGANPNGSLTYASSAAGLSPSYSGALSFTDYDNDGYMDVMMLGKTSGLKVFHNDRNLTANTTPAAPSNLVSSYDNESGKWTFTWDAGSDVETPAVSLRYNVYVELPGASGKVFVNVPADITTGYLKQARINAALTTTSYSIELPYEEFNWGVQTIDNGKLSSAFAVAQTKTVSTELAPPVKWSVNAYVLDGEIYVKSNLPATVTIYHVNGEQIASAGNVTDKAVGSKLTKGVYLVKVQITGETKIIKVIL